ncbi:MAG: acetyl-CoA carboxylase biotin carboxyl carrier protein subunit [Alphaproteobacteria bacterium]|nr:acetyl-CoA carboxylase biotin carboxyl carrier protein subunit [Alphaproteobacteria bacterium]
MPGLILNVLVEQGQKVEIGQGILSMEAMKMENILKTTIAGTIEKIHVKQGDKVNQRDTLVVLSELTS